MSVAFVFNPHSAGGATAGRGTRLLDLAQEVFGAKVTFLRTEHAGHAIALAADCTGFDRVIAVGGDGTANEVVNGLMAIPADDRPVFGVLSAGTGCDLVRSLGTPADPRDALELLRDGVPRACDTIAAELSGGLRYGINVVGFGISGAVVAAVNGSSKRFGGKATFAAATARVVAGWQSPTVAVSWDGGRWEGPLFAVFVANGQWCGGGMRVAPEAKLDDGLLDLTIIPKLSLGTALRYAPRLYDGRMSQVPGVVTARIRELSAAARDDVTVLVDTDGEQPGSLPIRVTVDPRSLRVVGRLDANPAFTVEKI